MRAASRLATISVVPRGLGQAATPALLIFTNPGPVTSLIEQAATATTGR